MTTPIMRALDALANELAQVPGVKTCRVGLEPDISPDDYPIIRVVAARKARHTQSLPGVHLCGEAELLIYFGATIEPQDAGGMPAVYARLFEIEQAVLNALAAPPGEVLCALYEETITDEDAIDAYKMMAVRATIIFPED